MISYKEFLPLVHDVLAQVEERLAQRRAGLQGVGTIEELDIMKQELAQLEIWLEDQSLPPSNLRRLRAPYIVIDAWPASDRLGERICALDYIFRHVLE